MNCYNLFTFCHFAFVDIFCSSFVRKCEVARYFIIPPPLPVVRIIFLKQKIIAVVNNVSYPKTCVNLPDIVNFTEIKLDIFLKGFII